MRHLVRERNDLHIESAGTAAYHVGELPDPRTRRVARDRGIEIETRAQHFAGDMFARFDLVIAMDNDNRRALERLAKSDAEKEKIRLLRDYDPSAKRGSNVPDPYYGELWDFEQVFAICERACLGLLRALDEDGA